MAPGDGGCKCKGKCADKRCPCVAAGHKCTKAHCGCVHADCINLWGRKKTGEDEKPSPPPKKVPEVVPDKPPPPEPVPGDVAALLARLSLTPHGLALVTNLGVHSVSDLRLLKEEHLQGVPAMKVVERQKLLAAITELEPTPRLTQPDGSSKPTTRVRVLALCVGINAYESPMPGRLDNAVNDARAVHEAVMRLPGAASTLVIDCGKAAFEAALLDFRDGTGACATRGMKVTPVAAADTAPAAAGDGDKTLALFFFAGHGMQDLSGRNLLLPADWRAPKPSATVAAMMTDAADACVSVGRVESVMQQADVFAGIVMLDCCRDVPDFTALAADFAAGKARAIGGGGGGTRGFPSGLCPGARGTDNIMVSFATGPGSVAQDRSTIMPAHSPFTAALVRLFSGGGGAPHGRRLNDLNSYLVEELKRDTGGRQKPHVAACFDAEAGNIRLGGTPMPAV